MLDFGVPALTGVPYINVSPNYHAYFVYILSDDIQLHLYFLSLFIVKHHIIIVFRDITRRFLRLFALHFLNFAIFDDSLIKLKGRSPGSISFELLLSH